MKKVPLHEFQARNPNITVHTSVTGTAGISIVAYRVKLLTYVLQIYIVTMNF